MKSVSFKWLLACLVLGVALLAVGSAAARVHVKPCPGGCDDGDGPPIPSAPAGPVINTGPPPGIDDGDQPADPDPAPTSTPSTPADQPSVPATPTTTSDKTVTTVTTVGQTTPQPPPPPPPACRNHPDWPSVPLGYVKDDEGNCALPRGEDNFGFCQGDQFILTPKSKMLDALKSNQVLGPWVEGIGLVCWISDLVTYHAKPADYVWTGKYVGDGGAQDFVYDCQSPYEGWLLYPYWVRQPDLTVVMAKSRHGNCK
jgi:hypothetical protein